MQEHMYLNSLGLQAFQQGNFPIAAQYFFQATQKDGEGNLVYCFNLAMAQMNMGDAEGCLQNLRYAAYYGEPNAVHMLQQMEQQHLTAFPQQEVSPEWEAFKSGALRTAGGLAVSLLAGFIGLGE